VPSFGLGEFRLAAFCQVLGVADDTDEDPLLQCVRETGASSDNEA
jgi:hypothetical protein